MDEKPNPLSVQFDPLSHFSGHSTGCVTHKYEVDPSSPLTTGPVAKPSNGLQAELVTANKLDTGKPDVTLIDPKFRLAMAKVLGFGEAKYGKANYRKGEGLDVARLIAAAERHMIAFQSGEMFDPETGESHLVHVSCCVMMAWHLHHRGGSVNTLPFQSSRIGF